MLANLIYNSWKRLLSLNLISVVLQGGDVADLLAPFFGAQDAAHDLARARLGQTRHELDLLGHGQRRELLADEVHDIQLQILLFVIQ
jgi:hypothetical protein